MSKLRNLGQAVGGGKGPWERRVLLWIGIIVVVSVVAVTGAYHFDQFTEGDVFCGKLCHPNRPEYVTHEVSPHANVECGECHIGPGLWPKVEAKIFGTAELVSLVANSYERPIDLPVERARPAEVICGQCHSELQPYAGRILEKSSFAHDEANSESVTRMLIRMDEGGAHWHIDNPVRFAALDDEGQEIVRVDVRDESGGEVTYQSSDVATSAELTEREMECTDCHNRATHQFRNPEELVDLALAAGIIDRGLPYVKRESMELLSGSYPTQEEGIEAMEALAEVYRSEFPDAYAAKQGAVEEAVVALQAIYHQTVFPEMNLTWDSYPDNVGHIDSPGCFRCHGSEMANAGGETIPANCTLCHSVPVVTRAGVQADPSMFAGTAGIDKPASHYDSAFSWEHRFLASDACAQCHGTIEFGTDGSSFCANGICHGGEWAEQAAEPAGFQHPVELPNAHGEALCYECHQGVREPALEDCATCHQPDSEPHYGTDCARCHTPEGWAASAASWVSDVPLIPHRVDGEMDCLACHAPGSDQPAPAGHEGFSGSVCLNCHEGATSLEASVIPHTIEGIDDCLACHGEGKIAPVPSDHEGRGNNLCTLCHAAS